MKSRDLWDLMIDIVSRCLQNDSLELPDQIIDSILESCSALDKEEAAFVRETVSGILRFEKVCEGMLKGYCDCLGRNKSDKFSMYIVTYLMIFQYKALGGPRIRELIYRCTYTPRLVEFLDYMLSPHDIMAHSNQYWDKYYDEDFIVDTICKQLSEIASNARQEIIQWMLGKTAVGVVGVDDTEDVNKPLSQKEVKQKVRVVHTTPPKSHGKIPPAEVREMVHTIPEKRPLPIDYKKTPIFPEKGEPAFTKPVGFSFMTRQQGYTSRVEQQPACHLEPVQPPSLKNVRRMLSKQVDVRMTAAAIRREAQNYLKWTEEQKRQLDEKEAALHDSREFEEWRRREDGREAELRAAKFLDRKAQIQFASNSAALKRKANEELKRIEGIQMQKNMALKAELLSEEKEREAARQRNNACKLRRELDEKRKKAIGEAYQERLSAAANVKAERERLNELAHVKEEKMKMQRLFVIQQIRQLRERNRQRRAELSKKNLLIQKTTLEDAQFGEMSLFELREKLRHLKEESARLEEDRRAHFQALRRQKREKIDELANMCLNWRTNIRRTREEEQKKKMENEAQVQALEEEEDAKRAVQVYNALKQTRSDRRAEYSALKANSRKRRNELLLLARGAFDIEEKHWMQQEQGVINRLTVKQNKEF